jgi:hypothetical protein
MSSARSVERIMSSVAALSKAEVKKHLRNFRGNFNLDFSESYLNSLSAEKLRHILMAALMTKK